MMPTPEEADARAWQANLKALAGEPQVAGSADCSAHRRKCRYCGRMILVKHYVSGGLSMDVFRVHKRHDGEYCDGGNKSAWSSAPNKRYANTHLKIPMTSTLRTPPMNYTDVQLKLALAKMLPEKIRYSGNDFAWIGSEGGFIGYVRDTELLHICWLVEETLNKNQQEQLLNEYPVRYWTIYHASWQQRTIALAKVKGVEIV